MNELTILFKNGQKLELTGENFIIETYTLTGLIASLEWENMKAGSPLPRYINYNEVLAVYETRVKDDE